MALTREWVELALKQAEANDASFVAPEFRESQRNYAELCRRWLAAEQDALDAARWRSIRHIKNLEVEMMKPAEWDKFADDRIAKRAAMTQKESPT